MPFSAKSAMPYGRDPVAGHWAFDEAADGGSTMFAAAPGYLLTEGLAEAVQRRERPTLALVGQHLLPSGSRRLPGQGDVEPAELRHAVRVVAYETGLVRPGWL